LLFQKNSKKNLYHRYTRYESEQHVIVGVPVMLSSGAGSDVMQRTLK